MKIESPEFHPNSLNGFFMIPLGKSSMHGDTVLTSTKSIVAKKTYERKSLSDMLSKLYGEEGSYHKGYSMRKGKSYD